MELMLSPLPFELRANLDMSPAAGRQKLQPTAHKDSTGHGRKWIGRRNNGRRSCGLTIPRLQEGHTEEFGLLVEKVKSLMKLL
jgi:hypothetical protein